MSLENSEIIIEKLERVIDLYQQNPQHDPAIIFDLEEAVDALKAMTTWRDVMDPPATRNGDSEYILLSFANFSTPLVGQFRVDEYGNGAYYIGDDEEPACKQDIFVNGWMPIPECKGKS